MIRLEKAGFPIVFHVHDEVICEVPIGKSSADEIADIMTKPIDWAPGIPLTAAAYECEYYRKD
jgi:DNA polymerase